MTASQVNYDGLSSLAASAAGLAASAGSVCAPMVYSSQLPIPPRQPGWGPRGPGGGGPKLSTGAEYSTVNFVRDQIRFDGGSSLGGFIWSPLIEKTAVLSIELQARVGSLGEVVASAASQLDAMIGVYQGYDDEQIRELRAAFPDQDFSRPDGGGGIGGSPTVTLMPLRATSSSSPSSGGADYADLLLGNWKSVSGLVMTVIEMITDWNPMDPVKEYFGGDWESTEHVADSLDELAQWFKNFGRLMAKAANATHGDWEGPAADACRAWFTGFDTDLAPFVEGIGKIADEYRGLGLAMRELGSRVADKLQDLLDELIILAASVGTASLIGGAVGAALAGTLNGRRVARVFELIDDIKGIFGEVEKLQKRLEALQAAFDIVEGEQSLSKKMPKGLALPAGG